MSACRSIVASRTWESSCSSWVRIPLAVSQGWVARDVVSRAWELWPLILIGVGIGLILRRTRFHFAGGLLVAATFGVMFGAVLAGGLNLGTLGCGSGPAATDPTILDQQGTFGGGTATVDAPCHVREPVRRTDRRLRLGCHRQRDRPNGQPTLDQASNHLDVRSPDRNVTSRSTTVAARAGRSRWGAPSPYSLDVNLNAGDASVDLSGLRIDTLTAQGNAIGSSHLLLHDATVGRLQVQVNAGDLRIGLPAGSNLVGQVQANAASIGLCADPGHGPAVPQHLDPERETTSPRPAWSGRERRGNRPASAPRPTSSTSTSRARPPASRSILRRDVGERPSVPLRRRPRPGRASARASLIDSTWTRRWSGSATRS